MIVEFKTALLLSEAEPVNIKQLPVFAFNVFKKKLRASSKTFFAVTLGEYNELGL